jgi:hypothetical protein
MPRRVFAAMVLLLLVSGCESYGDLTSDAFDPGKADQSRFLADSAQCQQQAEQKRSYDIPGIEATHAGRHEIFNRAYISCMQGNGYVRRDWTPYMPYSVDPWPG